MKSGVYPQHCLIGTALATSQTGELQVPEIYKMVKILFPFVVMSAPSSWKNSLRHSLSNSGYFEMVNKSTHPVLAAKKNHKWRINQTRANDLLRSMDKYNKKIAANNTALIGLLGAQASIVTPSLQQQLIMDPIVQSQDHLSGSQLPLSLPNSTIQNDTRQAPLIIHITTTPVNAENPANPAIDLTTSMKEAACPMFKETTSTTTNPPPFVESTAVSMTLDDSIPSLCMDFSSDISSESLPLQQCSSDISEAPTIDIDDCLRSVLCDSQATGDMFNCDQSESCQEKLLVTSQQLEELIQQSSDDQWLQDVDLNTLITPDTSDEAMSTVLSSTSDFELDNDLVVPSHAFDILEDLKLDEEDTFDVDITPSSSSDTLLEEKDNLIEDLLECLIITAPPDADNLLLSDAFCTTDSIATTNNHIGQQQMPRIEDTLAILSKKTDKWISDRWNKFKQIASREQFRKSNSSCIASKKVITEPVSRKRPRNSEMATKESAKRQKMTDIPGGQTVRKHSRTRPCAPVRQTEKCTSTTSIEGTYSQKHYLQDAAAELLPLKRPRITYSLRK